MTLDRSRPPASPPVEPFHFPEFEVEDLGGVELYLLPRDTLPLVHLEVALRCGADGEPATARGLATLGAALLSEGTARRSSQQIAEAAEGLGTEVQTSADWDGTYLELTLRSEHAAAGLDLLHELLTEADFPEAEVERMKRRRLADLRRRLARPDFLASRQMLRALYPDHVYGESLIGLTDDIERLGRDQVVDWAKVFRRAPASLLVTGSFDRRALEERMTVWGAFGTDVDEPSPTAPPRHRDTRRVVVVDRPQARQTELRVGHIGLPRVHPDRIAAQVLNGLLGGKFTSRLNLSLRERLGVTYGAWSRFSARRGRGPFVAGAAVETDATGRAATEILSEMERLRVEHVPEEELADTRSYLIGTFPYSLQALEGLAGRLEDLAIHPGLPRDAYRRWPGLVAAVDVEAVAEAARKHLHPERATIVAVGPAESLRPQLAALGPLEVVEAAVEGEGETAAVPS